MSSDPLFHNLSSLDAAEGCSSKADNVFGPQVATCRRSFDFTLLFEQSILSLLPSAIFLLAAVPRVVFLQRRPLRLGGKHLRRTKMFMLVCYAVLQLIILVVSAVSTAQKTQGSVAAAALSFVVACVLCLLSYLEHPRSIRPSAVIEVYLIFSLLFDTAQDRTLWLSYPRTLDTTIFTASAGLKIILLVLEASGKRSYIFGSDCSYGPEETSGALSRSFFWWLNHLILEGFKKILSMTDLYPLDITMSAQSLNHRFGRVWRVGARGGKYVLFLANLKALKFEMLFPVVPRIILLGFTFCQPLLVNRLLDFLSQANTAGSENIGYGLIGAYGIVYLGLAISTGIYYHLLFRWITMVRGTLVSEIYRKTTDIGTFALDNSAALTLMSADIERIVEGLEYFHEVWANILSIGIACFLLQRELHLAATFPVIVAVASGLLSAVVSSTAEVHQSNWLKKVQERVGITSTMLSSMKGIKMSGLTSKLSNVIQGLRTKEIAEGRRFRMIQTYTAIIAFIPIQISPVVAFAAFTGLSRSSGKTLDVSRLFTSLTLLQLLAMPLSQLFQAFPLLIASLGCFHRIQNFLLIETRSDHRIEFAPPIADDGMNSFQDPIMERGINMNNLTSKDFLSANSGECSAAVLVQNGTFGWKDDAPVLSDVNFDIRQSQLAMLIGPVASGKSTLLKAILGETQSSKGFVYVSTTDLAFCDQTPWLINASIRKNIIGFSDFEDGWYKSVLHACALEEDLALFARGDETLIGSAGITLSGGQKQRVAIARAVYARRKIALFDDVFGSFDRITEHLVFQRVFGPQGLLRHNGTTIILATHSLNHIRYADHVFSLEGGKLVEQSHTAQAMLSQEIHDQPVETKFHVQPALSSPAAIDSEVPNLDPQSNAKSNGDASVYRYYFNAIGRLYTFLFFFFQILLAFLTAFPTVWLKWWADANTRYPNEQIPLYLGVYSLLQILGLISLALLAWHCLSRVPCRSGAHLHYKILETVMAAPMAFFSGTDTGVIVNRFSQDIEIVDMELPNYLLNTVYTAFGLIASAGLISASSYYTIIAFPPIAVGLYLIQRFYLRTSRQLRFMDLDAKGPLYSQFIETLSGLPTIRAFNWQDDNQKLNLQLLDSSQKPFYLLFMVQRWLTLVLDLVGATLAVFVVSLAVELKGTASPGFTGVALVNLVSFIDNLKNLVLLWTNLETSIGAVSRIKDFEAETLSENSPEVSSTPPEGWPTSGKVDIQGLYAAYKPGSEYVLEDITLVIEAGERVGICGRSGSGKSSLILALARMLEISHGTIFVDNLDVLNIHRQSVRMCFNIIPQDPYFLHGTVRLNLDPYDTASTSQILSALHRAGLWDVIEANGGLEANMNSDLYSHGQIQLFCLVRAMLCPGKILILDEATSSVDIETDRLMQRIIREDFVGHTIIAIAHRVSTICDFDRVVVLDKGKVIECDSPTNLLSRETVFSELYNMDARQGRSTEANLAR